MHKSKTHSLLAALAITCLVFGAAFAAPNDDPAKAIKKVGFSNGVAYDGKVPEAYTSLEKSIKKDFEGATFEFKDGTLFVGTNASAKNEGVLEVTWKSDCPVNSKFEVTKTELLADADKVIKSTLVAFTEDRHPHLRGNEVERYNPPKGKNWYEYGEVVLKK